MASVRPNRTADGLRHPELTLGSLGEFETCPDWGAKLLFQIVRYLTDFITSLSEASSGLAPPDSDPGVDSNSSTDRHPQTNRRRSTRVPTSEGPILEMADSAQHMVFIENPAVMGHFWNGSDGTSASVVSYLPHVPEPIIECDWLGIAKASKWPDTICGRYGSPTVSPCHNRQRYSRVSARADGSSGSPGSDPPPLCSTPRTTPVRRRDTRG